MKFKLLLSLLLAVVFITGCNVSKEDALNNTKESFTIGIETERKEPNQQTDGFHYFLPTGLSVNDATENNLILYRGEQIYLIFSNPAEDRLSKVNYEQDRLIEEDAILEETIENEGLFSYIIVSPFEKDEYKAIVGIGGEKATTITNLQNLKSSVEIMLEMVNSIKQE